MTQWFRLSLVTLLLAFVAISFLGSYAKADSEKTISLEAVLIDGKGVWSPAEVTAHKGEKVTLQLHNKTEKEHGFAIDALKISEIIKPGEQKEIAITPEENLPYYCPLHKGHVGGTLVVH